MCRQSSQDEMTDAQSSNARAAGYESNALFSTFGKRLVAIYTDWRCFQSVTVHFD